MALLPARKERSREETLAELRLAVCKTAPKAPSTLPSIPCDLAALSPCLPDGFERGRMIEISGSSGRMRAAVAALASATGLGHLCALVDPRRAFDAYGARDRGVDLHKILWVVPDDVRGALQAADLLVGSGCFPLVVLSLVGVGRPSRMDHAWHRLSLRAKSSQSVLLVLSDQRLAGSSARYIVAKGSFAHFHKAPGMRAVLSETSALYEG